MKWDSAADQHLLLAILSAHKVNVDHNRVAQIVGCTPRACEERIKKLRKLAKECGYDVKESPLPSSSRKGRKGGKEGKAGKGKGKCIDNGDMALYRRGIVSDDTEVKLEDGMEIKREIIKREFEMGGYDGYEYQYNKDMMSFIRQPKMEGPSFLLATNIGNRDLNVSYSNTATGQRIPLGVPLEISCESSPQNARRGETYSDYSTTPPKKGLPKIQDYHDPTPNLSPSKTGYSTRDLGSVDFVEISPASKKDPIIIDGDDRGDMCGP